GASATARARCGLRDFRPRLGGAACPRAPVLLPRGNAHHLVQLQEAAAMKPINVGLLGIGVVGGGTWDVLARNREEIQRRAGREIRISVVADKDVEKARRLTAGAAQVVADGNDVVGN